MRANQLNAGDRVLADGTTWRIIHVEPSRAERGRLTFTLVEVGTLKGGGMIVDPGADVPVPRGRKPVG